MPKKSKPAIPEGDEVSLEEVHEATPDEVREAMSRIIEQDNQPPKPEPEPEQSDDDYGFRAAYEDLRWVKLREGRAMSRHAVHRLLRAMEFVRHEMEQEELF